MNRRNARLLAESLSIIAIILIIGRIFRPDDPLLRELKPHPFWGVILLSALRYGNPAGITTGLFCAAIHMVGLAWTGFNFVEALYIDIGALIVPVLYIAVGGWIGETVESDNNRIRFFREQSDKLKTTVADTEARLANIENAYRKVEGRLAGDTDTIINFYNSVSGLETFSSHEIRRNIKKALQDIFEVDKCSVWIPDGENNWKALVKGDYKSIPRLGLIALREKRVVNIREFASRNDSELATAVMAGIVCNQEGNPDCVVIIEKMPFTRFAERTIMLFDILLKWCSRSIQRQVLLEQSRSRDVFDLELGLTSELFFRTCAEKIYLQTKRMGSPSSILLLDCPRSIKPKIRHRLLIVIGVILRTVNRTSDVAAFFRKKEMLAVFLPGTSEENASVVIKKLTDTLAQFGFDNPENGKALSMRHYLAELKDDASLDEVLDEAVAKAEAEFS